MYKKICLAFLIFSLFGISYAQETILNSRLYLYQNDTVEKIEFGIIEGRSQLHIDTELGEYEVRILDEDRNVIIRDKKIVYFGYTGPVFEYRDYSNVTFEAIIISSQIPYTPDMKEYQLVHDGKIIFSEEIIPCNNNNICEIELGENSDNCPDCKITTTIPSESEEVDMIYALIPPLILLGALFYLKYRGFREKRILKRVGE